MAPNVAAAIERVTNNVTELRPRDLPDPGMGLALFEATPSSGREIELVADVVDLRPIRSRIEIVPLISQAAHYFPSPPGASQSPIDHDHEADVIDLREPRGRRNRGEAGPHACAACSAQGHVDVIDNVNGILHVSCPNCFRMWTENARHESVPTDR